MRTDNVTSAKRLNDNSIEMSIKNSFNSVTITKRYAAVRGGISWPTTNSPAYLCLIGQEYVEPKCGLKREQNGQRILLAEYLHDALSLDGFYQRTADLAEQLMCMSFYVEMPDDKNDCGFLNDFDEYTSRREFHPCLVNAHDVDNFFLGVSRIKDDLNMGSFVIPDNSIVYGQLRDLTRQDLEDSPEERFYAINALRHVIGSYYRHPGHLYEHTPRSSPSNWRTA